MDPCSVSGADRVGFADGTLRGARREFMDEHVPRCPWCQAWLRRFRDTHRLLEQGTAVPTGTAVRVRLAEADPRAATRPWRRAAIAVALALAFALFAFGAPGRADLRLARFLHLTEEAPIPRRPQFVMPATLPLGLEFVAAEAPDPSRRSLQYTNASGLEIRVDEGPVTAAVALLPAADANMLVIGGTEVVLIRDPRPDTVAALLWTRGGVDFQLLVLASPQGRDGGLRIDDGLLIVRALFAAQDAATKIG